MSLVPLITACFHALFLIIPFLFTWSNSELFEFNKMLGVYIFTIIIGGLWLARMVTEKRLIWKKHPAVLFILLFLAGQALATLFSIHFRTSVLGFYSRLNGGFLSSLAYTVLFLALINNVPKKQAFSLLLTSVIGAVLAALYAIPEHFGVSPSCYLMKKEWTVNCWKQDVQARVFGTFGQPNWLAMYLAGLLPITWLLFQKQLGSLKKIWLGGLVILLLAIWFTQSRSGMVAAGAAGAAWVVLTYQSVWLIKLKLILRSKLSRTITLAATICVLIAGGVLLSTAIPPSETGDFDLSQGTESGSIRLIVWRGALKVWQRYPLFGSGPGTFAYSYYQDRPVEHNLVSEWSFLYNKAHNEFLNYLAETGAVGLITYLAFLIGVIWLLSTQLPKDSRQASIAQAVIASLIVLSAANFFGFSTVTSNLLLFLLPAIALLSPDDGKQKLSKLRLWQLLSVILICVMVLTGLLRIGTAWKADWWYTKGRKQQEKLEYAEALISLQTASQLVPGEPLYYDELANLYSKLALEYSLVGEAEASQQLAKAAIQNSDFTVLLNPRHLNFYKTRLRVFFSLAQIDQKYFTEAEQTLLAALELSPTDPQLWYNLGILQQETGRLDEAVQTLQYTISIKPDYIRARSQLADLLVQLGRTEEGKSQYQFILDKLSSTDEEVKAKLEALD